jgi:hypothetical protein
MSLLQFSKGKKVHCCCNLRAAGAIVGSIRLLIIASVIVSSCLKVHQKNEFIEKYGNETMKKERSEIFTYVTKLWISLDFATNLLWFFGIYYCRHLLLLPLVFVNAIWFGSALLSLPVAI